MGSSAACTSQNGLACRPYIFQSVFNFSSEMESDNFSLPLIKCKLQNSEILKTLITLQNTYLSFEHSGYQFFMLFDNGIQFGYLFRSFFFSSLSHQNFQDLLQPFFDLSTLQIFAKGLKMVIILGSNMYIVPTLLPLEY